MHGMLERPAGVDPVLVKARAAPAVLEIPERRGEFDQWLLGRVAGEGWTIIPRLVQEWRVARDEKRRRHEDTALEEQRLGFLQMIFGLLNEQVTEYAD